MTAWTRERAQALADFSCAVRPTGARRWSPADVMAQLEKLRTRDLGAVILATIRCAMDRHAERPECIASAGSHWSDTRLVSEFVPATAPVGTRCTVCGQPREAAHDHDRGYTPPRPPLEPDALHEHAAKVRAEVTATSGPTEHRTLDELAEANPELHAKVEAVRAALPGVARPPMRETEDETTATRAALPAQRESGETSEGDAA